MVAARVLLSSSLLVFSTWVHAEMKVYDVEPGYRQEVFDALSNILGPGGPMGGPPGRVELLPSGQILVDSSPERHEEILAVLNAIDRQAPPDTPSVSLRYWVLFATAGAQDDGEVPPILSGVVRELESARGDLNFTVLDTASLVGRPDRHAVLESETLEIAHRVYPNGSRVNAEIVISHEYQEISMNVTLERGEFLVLSEATVENEAGTRGTLAFVVHWPAGD
jgi:hypothetical protein